jgi:Amt family ammonium transporter
MELAYSIDTFYFLIMGAMVMLMGAGFTMLEAGMVRTKNVTEILTKNIALYSVACLMFMICGYNIMYGGTAGSWIPGFDFFVTSEHAAASADNYYSKMSDFFFQVVFVATAMSIVSGAVAERMKLWSFLLFAVVMTGFIYPVEGFWKWGKGALDAVGFLDFAGSGIVHMAGAAAALAGVLLLGARKGKYVNGRPQALPASNLTLVALGTWLLWFGWFGFNGGSQLKLSTFEDANAVAQIFVNTNMAAVGGLLAALIASRLFTGKSDLTMALNGALAGLVSITAEPLAGSALISTLIGAVGGLICYASVLILDRKFRIDDPVGAISVHGTAGIWGLLAVAITNAEASFVTQLYGTAVIFAWVFVTSLITWWIIKKVVGIRVSVKEEHEGSDMEECGLMAYPEFRQSNK